MKHVWLYLSNSDIETERRQCEEEGRDLTSVEERFEQVQSLDLEDLHNQHYAEELLDQTIALPLRPDFKFDEPSELDAIRAVRRR